MAQKIKSITQTRNHLNTLFDTPGVHGVTVRGQLAGVLISCGSQVRENTANRLQQTLPHNQRAAINELLDLIQNPEN